MVAVMSPSKDMTVSAKSSPVVTDRVNKAV